MVVHGLWWESWGSSGVSVGISGAGSCCLREIRSLFEFQGPVATPVESLLVNRTVSSVSLGNSVFLSGSNWDLGLPIKVQLGNQASSVVEAHNSAFLSSCQSAVRPSVEFTWGIWVFQEVSHGRQTSHLVRGYSMFHWKWCRGISTYLEQKGNSTFFFLAAGSAGFHSSFSW